MKHNIFNRFTSWAAATVLLVTASCNDDTFSAYDQPLSEDVNVRFTISNEISAVAGRSSEPTITDRISGGSKIDMLIYAVYDETGNLLEGYSNGTDEELAALGFDHGDGQTVKKVAKFPYEVNITLKRGEKYTVAFWAQSSQTKAYDTSDLRKIEVKYGEFDNSGTEEGQQAQLDAGIGKISSEADGSVTPNNDEYRDAFCRKVTFTAGESGTLSQNVYLYRPFAQINVGTTGYDFESVTRGSTKQYIYSKIRINRVARYLDLYENKTYTSTTDDQNSYDGEKTTESFYVVDFGYAPIPAYFHNIDEGRALPEPAYTKYDWEYDPNFSLDNVTKDDYADEEFLRVKFYDKDGKRIESTKDDPQNEDDFIGYANLNNYADKQTETFKYLSMCYVLTASDDENATVLNNVKVWLATDENGTDEIEILNINQVPAQRNWRTNIVGNLLTENAKFTVLLDKDFAGDYNGIRDNDKIDWSGPIAQGVYYNAEDDVIEISDVNGLLWFQQMVNGKLLVRDSYDKSVPGMKDKYPYYDLEDETKTMYLSDNHIDPFKLEDEILDRIIKATHIDKIEVSKRDTNVGSNNQFKWPNNYNFNFYGAKVKLMADIDLAGIEWIPIGFDFCIHDNTIRDKDKVNINYNEVLKAQGTRRLFCGTFDGNGHTIKNLKNKRFGAKVHDLALQSLNTGDAQTFFDNVQWMPVGFFGMIGEGAVVKDLNLENIDLYGYHTAGAVAGIAFSANQTTDTIVIKNCNVNGGNIYLSPMYRGDAKRALGTTDKYAYAKSRTFARGIYAGGIIGHMVAPKGSSITGCTVRNASIHAYRRIGGILGSISNSEQSEWESDNWDIDISGNNVSNTTIIADKFQPYDRMYCDWESETWKNGFGWVKAQAALGDYIVGGITQDKQDYSTKFNNNNQIINVVFTELATGVSEGSTSRKSEIGNISLSLMPMLSSWFTDEISLQHNYYGAGVAKTRVNVKGYNPWECINEEVSKYSINVPMYLPNDLSIKYVPGTPNVGMYVESVTLNGKEANGGRSVITAENVSGEGACTMYITARDRKQFIQNITSTLNQELYNNIAKIDFAKPTEIEKVTLKGAPYAWAGILIAPNENMSKVTLTDVAIYDVYKTIAMDEATTSSNQWPNKISASNSTLEVNKSNLRGFTVPGKGWKKVSYNNTTFEEGIYIKSNYTGMKDDDTQTCKVEATTTFEECFFKAPYIIDLTGVEKSDVTFTECYATSASNNNKKIQLPTEGECKYIVITKKNNGDPKVEYKSADGVVLKEQ